ncbi:MAG: type II toxin-antitoxin system antitoxin SocA domain-containing protein [Pseudomonadota bacterium]
MPHDARSIANFFLDQAEANGVALSHLKIQKLLFFAHAWNLAKFDQPLIGQPFEAWKYGPVVRVVYDQLKSYKSKSVVTRLTRIDPTTGEFTESYSNYNSETRELLSSIYYFYGQFHALKLSDLTHQKGGPWDRTWGKAKISAVNGMIIPDNLIKSWFEEKVNHPDWGGMVV